MFLASKIGSGKSNVHERELTCREENENLGPFKTLGHPPGMT